MDEIKVYDQYGNQIESWDEAAGWLKPSTQTVHHEAVEAVEEVWHWEVLKEYPNGGRDVARIVDVPGVAAMEAWDEEMPIYIYTPYTQEELDEMNKPSDAERIKQLEQALEAFIGGITSVQ